MDSAQRPSPQPDGVEIGDLVSAAVDLYWIPLGAGSPIVQASGQLFETISARRHRRRACDLYHAALQVSVRHGRYTIEQAPVPDDHGESRGVVAVGPVGIRAAGRLRVFRYEVRCWRDGTIPDIADAVDSPVHLTTDHEIAVRVLELLPSIPTPVWGRDEAATGDMWNSNSVIAWVLTRSGIAMDPLQPPPGGRAPGWNAGRIVAAAGTSPVDASEASSRVPTRPSPIRQRHRPHIHRHPGVMTEAIIADPGPLNTSER